MGDASLTSHFRNDWDTAIDNTSIAAADVPYVTAGPNAQYEAQARSGPSARPSCPEDLKVPSAFPFASSGCSSIILPVTSSTMHSSHCREANAVKEFTTVALVNAIQTAAACKSLIAVDIEVRTYPGRKASMISANAQDNIPCLAMLPSPTLDIDLRT